jgi:outer membrane lipoprotein carrier protein
MTKRLAWFAVILLAVFPAVAQAKALPQALSKSLERLSAENGFSCSFEQVLTFSDGSQQHYKGTLAVARPGRFRWHYTQPYEQLYVSDGERIWHYEPDLMQVTVLKHMESVDPAIMKLLDGRLGMKDVTLLATDAANRRYRVHIHGGPEIWIALDAKGGVAYVEGVDTLGNRNRIYLKEIEYRMPDAEVFSFKPPKGVDVVTQ